MELVGGIASLMTLMGVAWGIWSWLRANRKVSIVITCGDRRLKIADLPARLVSRAEVNGLIGQFAGQGRFDLTGLQFDYYNIPREFEVPLNECDFNRVESVAKSRDATNTTLATAE